MRCLAAITAGMLMVANTATSDDKLVVAGVGANSCGKFIADIEAGHQILTSLYFSWVQGFLTGLNTKYLLCPESATELSDHDALMLWIKNYCEENPLDQYLMAVTKLWAELRVKQKIQSINECP